MLYLFMGGNCDLLGLRNLQTGYRQGNTQGKSWEKSLLGCVQLGLVSLPVFPVRAVCESTHSNNIHVQLPLVIIAVVQYVYLCSLACPHPSAKSMHPNNPQIHRERCPNKKVKCSLGCGGLFQDGDLETHMTSECPKRLCSCEHCKQDIPLDSIQVIYHA